MADAIVVKGVSKRFRLEHERNSTLKATVLHGFKRTVYDEFWALDDIDLTVPQGSTFALVGHNGSGKSTLLKCMARIYRPDRGQITTTGKISALLELGAGFHPELSGRENVYLNGSILGLSHREVSARFDEIVSFSGLERFIDTPVKNYSSGMFVRLGFAVAINVQPDVLLIDEVLAVGDESFQQRCMEKFAELRRSGRTLVVVSHGLDTVRNICDQAAWFDHGKIVQVGPAGTIVDGYLAAVRDQRRERENAALHGPGGAKAGVWSILDVTPLDRDGRRTDLVNTGDPVTLRVEIDAVHEEEITLELGLFRSDGIHVAGPVLRFATTGPGRHVIDYDITHLPLTRGIYDISATILDVHGQATYATAPQAARFDVAEPTLEGHGGVLALGGRWAIHPADSLPSLPAR